MTKTTVRHALRILELADAVIFRDCVSIPLTDSLTGDPEHSFCFFSWSDKNVGACYTKFLEGNANPRVHQSSLLMTDFEGDEIKITPLFSNGELEDLYRHEV